MSDPKEIRPHDQSQAKRLKRPQSPNDVVIYNNGSGGYIITKSDGERLGTAEDRLEAMRRGCVAARASGASVWICVDHAAEVYHEVLCP